MTVEGSVFMWVFGMVFVAFSSLVGIIWAMLNKRLNMIETMAQDDRRNLRDTVNDIYNEIKCVNANMARIAETSGERKADCIERFATKDELIRAQDSINSGSARKRGS